MTNEDYAVKAIISAIGALVGVGILSLAVQVIQPDTPESHQHRERMALIKLLEHYDEARVKLVLEHADAISKLLDMPAGTLKQPVSDMVEERITPAGAEFVNPPAP